MCMSAGITTSGAKAIEPPAAVGTMVPSSLTWSSDAPRAQYEWKRRSRPSITTVVSMGPSLAVSPHTFSP